MLLLHLVTDFAVFLDGKGRAAVVAGATGRTAFHLGHGCARVFPVRRKKHARMTLAATEETGMNLVTEDDLAAVVLEGHVVRRVAGRAVFAVGNGKRLATIVTEAARFALAHLGHGRRRIFFGGDIEDGIVAGRAVLADGFKVVVMAELDGTGGSYRHHDLVLNPAGKNQGWAEGEEQGENQEPAQLHCDLQRCRIHRDIIQNLPAGPTPKLNAAKGKEGIRSFVGAGPVDNERKWPRGCLSPDAVLGCGAPL